MKICRQSTPKVLGWLKHLANQDPLSRDKSADLKQKIVYHEAGHATGIHFSSMQKKHPPVFFQIIFTKGDDGTNTFFDPHTSIAKIEGGRLIESLPLLTFAQTTKGKGKSTFEYTHDYRLAFETDITNLIIGSLAEAKYTALKDDEPFHHELLTVQSLKYYGGEADIAMVNDYLQSYSIDEQEQNELLERIFKKAFNFVDNHSNWKAISRLADYILTSRKNTIDCGEVAVVLEAIHKKPDVSNGLYE